MLAESLSMWTFSEVGSTKTKVKSPWTLGKKKWTLVPFLALSRPVFSFISFQFQVWFLFSLDEPHALSLSWDGPRIQRNWHYLTISVTRLGLLPGSSQFHNSIKLEERNASSSKCLLKLLLFVHGVMSVSLSWDLSFHFYLKLREQPTKGTDSHICFALLTLSVIL